MQCPIAGQDNTILVRKLSPREISAQWLRQYAIDVGENFRGLPLIEHWRCNVTGFEWYEPAQCAGDHDLYEQLQRHPWYYMEDKWEFRAALGFFSEGDRILEVGAGSGYFLNAARRCRLDASGVELNLSAAEVARGKGFTIYEEELNDLAGNLGPVFDGVCALQVLEHIPSPMHFLEELLELLRAGGKLVLSVPNSAVATVVDPEHTDLLNQPPHHVSHWNEGVFSALETLLPVKLLAIKREPLQEYHVDWFVSLVMARWQRKLGKVFGRMLVNSVTTKIAKRLLGTLRRFIPGHTLLVVFEKRSAAP